MPFIRGGLDEVLLFEEAQVSTTTGAFNIMISPLADTSPIDEHHV